MYSDAERREYVRNDVDIPVSFSEKDVEFLYSARLCDLSKSGMRFISDTALKSGSEISIKPEDPFPDMLSRPQPDDSYHAEVKWCRENTDINIPGYTIGVKYYEKFWERAYDEGLTHLDPNIWETSYTELIRPTFDKFSNKSAFTFMGIDVSFSDLDRFSNSFAHMLLAHGLGKGDVVGINLPNIPEYIISWLGTLKAGCVVSGVSPLLSNEEMEYQLQDCKAKALVTLDAIFAGRLTHIESRLPDLKVVVAASVGGFLPGMKRILGKLVGKIPKGKVTPLDGKAVYHFKEIIHLDRYSSDLPDIISSPDDISYIQYTGGTTGTPKGAMLTHRNIVSDLLIFEVWGGDLLENSDGVSLSGFPFFHTAGLFFNITCIYAGFTQVLIPNPRDTDHICAELGKYNPDILVNVPSLYQMLIKNSKFMELDHSNLKLCVSGASPFPADSQKELESIVGQGKLLEVYGMTETSPLASANPYINEKKLGTVGLPMLNTDIKLVDPDTSKEVRVGEPGEVLVKGPQVMKGFYNKPEETKNSFTEDGFLRTGDVAVFDKEGYLTIVDRVKDMLLVGGFNVYSKKIEDTLSQHPGVDMIAIIGLPNPDRPGSEIVKAFVTVIPEYSYGNDDEGLKDDIIRLAREKLAPYEVPKLIEIEKELPLTAVGKVDKKVLRAKAA